MSLRRDQPLFLKIIALYLSLKILEINDNSTYHLVLKNHTGDE